jgi:hypothetical protein
MNDLQQAIRDYDREVESVAASLIRVGVSPWVAVRAAAEDVRRRRRERRTQREHGKGIDLWLN